MNKYFMELKTIFEDKQNDLNAAEIRQYILYLMEQIENEDLDI